LIGVPAVSFSPGALSPLFSYIDSAPALSSGSDTLLVRANPQRVAIFFSVSATGNVFIRPAKQAVSGMGFILNASVFNQGFSFAEYGSLVQQEWHAFTAALGPTMYILEVIYNPTGE
jgi:hypothetical protein